MTKPAYLKFEILQGATFERTLQYSHGVMLRSPMDSGRHVPRSSISVHPLTCALPIGFVLPFTAYVGRTVDLVVATAASIGDDEIDIQPYTGELGLPYQSVAKGAPEDLTGQSWRGQIRSTAASSQILATLPMVVVPLSGLVTITIPATVTAALAPNAEYADYSAGSYSAPPYALDIESEIGGVVVKRGYGDAYVIREVTR